MKPDITIFKYTLPLFIESWYKEINGLLKKSVFKFINTVDILKGVKIFNSQFVDEIKNTKTDKAFKKFKLVI
jgi:hypothetical protein